MKLATPSFAIWLISTVLVALVVLSTYFGVSVPVLTPIIKGQGFEVVLVAWALLFIGVTFNI